MTVGMTGPTTLEQIRWSARLYRRSYSNFASAWAEVNTEDFRRRAMDGCDDQTAEALRRFLARFKTYAGRDVRDALQGVIRDEGFAARNLQGQALSDVDMVVAQPAVEMAFDQLMRVRRVGLTIAAKVLAVLNPELFVMWDGPIFLAYCYPDAMGAQTIGAAYANFLVRMQGAARAIVFDAQQNYDVWDVSGQIRDEIGSPDHCTLAKLVDEYNYLTITRGEVDPNNPSP